MKSSTKQRASLGPAARSPKSATQGTSAVKKGKKKKQATKVDQAEPKKTAPTLAVDLMKETTI